MPCRPHRTSARAAPHHTAPVRRVRGPGKILRSAIWKVRLRFRQRTRATKRSKNFRPRKPLPCSIVSWWTNITNAVSFAAYNTSLTGFGELFKHLIEMLELSFGELPRTCHTCHGVSISRTVPHSPAQNETGPSVHLWFSSVQSSFSYDTKGVRLWFDNWDPWTPGTRTGQPAFFWFQPTWHRVFGRHCVEKFGDVTV